MIVTIDGPAGTGKSTAARQLASRLGFEYLDTGAMYRAIALLCQEAGIDLQAPEAARIAAESQILFRSGRTIAMDQDVTDRLRTPAVSQAASVVAQHARVREALVARQRELAGVLNFVCEGRDQGTVVFPQAECKFFLTATAEERARRRQVELQAAGQTIPFEELLAQQKERDERDSSRDVSPLRPAEDALIIDTTRITLPQVIDHLESVVRSRMTG